MKINYSLLLACVFFNSAAYSKPLTFEESSIIALRDNTDILSIREQEESAKHHEAQSLSPNTPQLSFSNNNSATPFHLSEGASKTYSVIWTLGFPGKSLFQSKQFHQLSESNREQGLEKEVSILTTLSNLYVSITSNEKLIKILEQEVERTSEVVKIIQKKYAMGQASQVDLLSSKSAVAKLGHDLLNAKETSHVYQTQFRNIIRKPDSDDTALALTSIEVPPMNESVENLVGIMIKNRHAIQAAQFQVSASNTNVLLSGMQVLPDIQFTASMNLYRVASSQPDSTLSRDYSLGLQFNIPLFFAVNELNTYRASRSDRASVEYQADSVRLQAIADLKSNYTLFQAAYRNLEDIERFLAPATKASYDLVLKSYSLGKADYLRLSDARNSWIETQKDEINKRSDLAQAFNNITLIVGCDFRNKDGPHACQ